MSTRGDLVNRIIDELHLTGQSFTAQVVNAVHSAVEYYRGERLWFMEGATSFTLATTSTVTLSSQLPEAVTIDTIRMATDSGSAVKLVPVTWDEFQSLSTMTAQPEKYAIHHRILHFWPVNNRTRSVEVTWAGRVTLSASNSSSCVWTNEAEELIRTHAKIDLCENYLRDYPQADRLRLRALTVFSQLSEETIRRLGLGKLKGTL